MQAPIPTGKTTAGQVEPSSTAAGTPALGQFQMAAPQHVPGTEQLGHHPLQRLHAHRLRQCHPRIPGKAAPRLIPLQCQVRQPRINDVGQLHCLSLPAHVQIDRLAAGGTHSREKVVTYTIAPQGYIGIAGVLQPPEAGIDKGLTKIRAAQMQQRTKERQVTLPSASGHPATTVYAAPLQHAHADRFGLIVEMVGKTKGIDALLLGKSGKGAVATMTGCSFAIDGGCGKTRMDKRNPPFCRLLGQPCRMNGGVLMPSMIDMPCMHIVTTLS